ncbi:MAG: transcriptional regulator MraZ, partial [Humisphaera sp.]|nr:transcriptional regulator MraZ [Humisphaera sp.]
MRHLVLSGNFDLTVDDKNRILVPSEVRKKLDPERDGEAFFLVTGRDGRLWLYPERYYEQLISREPTELTPSEDTMAFDRMMLGLASRVEWDKQGRVLLPDRQLKRAGIGKDVTLVGARDHLELWNRADWDAEREQLEARRADVIEKIR